MNGPRHQAICFIQSHHHGAEDNIVLEHGLGHVRCQALVLAQVHHRADIALTHLRRINDLDILRQFQVLGIRNPPYLLRITYQGTPCQLALMTDDGCLYGSWFAALRQDDALVGSPGTF